MQLLGSRPSGGGGGGGGADEQPVSQSAKPSVPPKATAPAEPDDDEIPF
jgi:hypothetical protein